MQRTVQAAESVPEPNEHAGLPGIVHDANDGRAEERCGPHMRYSVTQRSSQEEVPWSTDRWAEPV